MSLYVSVDTQGKKRMDVFVQFYECLSILCCKNTSDCNICYSIKCLVLHCVQDVISPCPSSPPRKLANLPSNILPVPLCRAAAARRHKGSQFNNLQFSCSQWSACAWSPVTTLTHRDGDLSFGEKYVAYFRSIAHQCMKFLNICSLISQ